MDTRLRFFALSDECPNPDHCTEECELCGGRVRIPVSDEEELLVRFYDYILDYEHMDLEAAINDLYSLWKNGAVDLMCTWESV